MLIFLGEDEFSYVFDGRGLKAENGQFEEFGQTFGENDVIGCFAVSAPESCGFVAKSGWRALEILCFPSAASLLQLMRCLHSCVAIEVGGKRLNCEINQLQGLCAHKCSCLLL